MDYIFIIGPSAVGKTTLAKSLFEHYNSVYIEQNMVPEFSIPIDVQDEGLFEEKICFENTMMQIEYFHKLGYKNIVALDFDDLRTRELPLLFKGYNFVTLKLVSSNFKQISEQMKKRHDEGKGLWAISSVETSNEHILKRNLLPNEVLIDINGKTKDDVFNEAINIIDNFCPEKDYEYILPDKSLFNSWVKSNNLIR